MIVKQPFVWSTSGYNHPDVDPRNSAIPVAAALCRASIGTPAWMGGKEWARDKSFPKYWPLWGSIGLPRSAYHFLINEFKKIGIQISLHPD